MKFRSMNKKPKTFKNFPENKICPVCKTSDNGECILLPIDGTEKGYNCEAIAIHLWCAIAARYNPNINVIYTKLGED